MARSDDKPRFRIGPAPGAGPRFAEGEYAWIELNAIENLKGRIATADLLAKEATATLTILLTGVGGSLAFAIKGLDGVFGLTAIAATVACGWLMFLTAALLRLCMRIRSIPPVYNEPENLLRRHEQQMSFDEWRVAELGGVQRRIDRVVARNELMATRLNLVRELAYLTPVVVGLGVLFCWRSADHVLVAVAPLARLTV